MLCNFLRVSTCVLSNNATVNFAGMITSVLYYNWLQGNIWLDFKFQLIFCYYLLQDNIAYSSYRSTAARLCRRYCMEILRRATSLSDSLLYKGFRAMFPGYCFSKTREAPDITLPESQAVRFIQLSRTNGPLCGRHVWKKPAKCESARRDERGIN